MTAILDKARALLQGEPLRAVVYGAAVVVWLVVKGAQALGIGHFPAIDLDTALTTATAVAVGLAELARRWTVSPATFAAATALPSTVTVTANVDPSAAAVTPIPPGAES